MNKIHQKLCKQDHNTCLRASQIKDRRMKLEQHIISQLQGQTTSIYPGE